MNTQLLSTAPSPSRIPADTLQAYRETLFIVQAEESIELRVDVANPSLLQMYRDTGTDRCAFITACNPHSQQCSDAANAVRQANLDAQALGRKYEQNAIVWCGRDAVPKLVLLR